jgi:hypothetical protein
MSSWLAAYQRAVDNATSHSKNLREYVADKQASLGTLEEAGRQLREAVSSVTTTVAQTAQRATSSATATIQTVQRATTARNELMEREMAREMSAYGITDEYVEAVRSKLEYGIFRDHQLDDRVCAGPSGRDDDDDDDDGDGDDGDDGKHRRLNAWQERHVILLLQRVKEVDALRFALCPKYMEDGVFWAIYFDLVRKMLPSEAYEYAEGDDYKLPRRYEEVMEERSRKNSNPGGLEFLESRLREMRVIGGRSRGADASKDGPSARSASKEPAPSWQGDEGKNGEERGIEGRPDATLEDEEYITSIMDVDDIGEGEALDDDELDAYLDTLALTDSDDGT